MNFIYDLVMPAEKSAASCPVPPSDVQTRVCRSRSPSAAKKLSRREGEVLREIGLGLSNRQIAKRLLIAESTVKTHRGRIYEKLQVSTRYAALAEGRSRGLLLSY
jgi:DNA-binding CsgD family transcriptional regulator